MVLDRVLDFGVLGSVRSVRARVVGRDVEEDGVVELGDPDRIGGDHQKRAVVDRDVTGIENGTTEERCVSRVDGAIILNPSAAEDAVEVLRGEELGGQRVPVVSDETLSTDRQDMAVGRIDGSCVRDCSPEESDISLGENQAAVPDGSCELGHHRAGH